MATIVKSIPLLANSIINHHVVSASSIGVRTLMRQRIQSLDKDIATSLPEPPKRPPTSWSLFVRERKDDILSRGHNMKASQLAMILSKEWQQIDKSKYVEEYARAREQYYVKKKDFQESLTQDQKGYLIMKDNIKKEKKALRELAKTKPPKMPRNVASMYSSTRCNEPEVRNRFRVKTAAQVFKEILNDYRELSEHEKLKYLDMQQEDLRRFEREFWNWYQSVVNDSKLSEAAKDQAELIKARFYKLGYIQEPREDALHKA